MKLVLAELAELARGGRFVPALLVAFLLLGFAGCRSSPDEAAPAPDPAAVSFASHPASVLLITIDTLRADRLAAGGPMPRLWTLAESGYRFTAAHTPVPMTLPAHASLLTGLGPRKHGVRDNIGYTLPEEVPTVAESFASAGWSTAAFLGGYPLDHAFGLARGFDVYDDRMTRRPADGREGHTERRAEEVVDSALAWLRRQDGRRFFLWVHLFDPHDPYEAPAPFHGRHAEPYDDEVAYTDDELGRLIDEVMAARNERPWIVVAGDHGESLGEHGETTHGIFLYESTLHVPLVVVPPDPATQGRTLGTPVALTDLAPTMLEAAGAPALPSTQGRSLLSVMAGAGAEGIAEPRPLYLESIHGRRRYGWSTLSGFLDWPEKFVSAPTPELYDLRDDPGETTNRFTSERADELELRLHALLGASDASETAADADLQVDLERLKSLGYVGASAVAQSQEVLDDRPRPDPKDRIAAVPHIDRALAAMASGRNAEAQRAFEAALAADPDNTLAWNDLGLLALRTGDLPRAETFFRRALERDANSETTANNLGLTLGGMNRYAEAEQAFRNALAVRPTFTIARFNLAFMLLRQGTMREALTELERVESEQPDFPGLQETMDEVRRSLPAPSQR